MMILILKDWVTNLNFFFSRIRLRGFQVLFISISCVGGVSMV